MSIPEGATHTNCGYFYRKLGPTWQLFGSGSEWIGTACDWDWLELNAHPLDSVKKWSGPQDGLPPVGTVCEVRINFTPWQKVEVIAHFKNKAMVAAFIPVGDVDKRVNQAIAECFRPIKTPDQIAAEQRETAIREIMDIADVDCRVTAARLVDAGFKREVV